MANIEKTIAGRSGRQNASFALSFAALIVVPALLALSLQPRATTSTLLVYLPVASLLLGLIDATWFRFTWSFPAIAAVMFWVSTALMYNPGTWIYAVGVFVVCALGGAIGNALTARGGR